MAKKENNVLGFMAFSSIIIYAICKVIEILSRLIAPLASIVGTLNYIADFFVLLIVLWVAWTFAGKCKKAWKIVYFVILGIIILGLIFGFSIR